MGVVSLVGGLSILLGYRAEIGAWLVVLLLVVVTPVMHEFWGLTDPMMAQVQMIMFLKNLSMLGGALPIAQFGPGPLSLDARRPSDGARARLGFNGLIPWRSHCTRNM
jgi:putative oxidoreductase